MHTLSDIHISIFIQNSANIHDRYREVYPECIQNTQDTLVIKTWPTWITQDGLKRIYGCSKHKRIIALYGLNSLRLCSFCMQMHTVSLFDVELQQNSRYIQRVAYIQNPFNWLDGKHRRNNLFFSDIRLFFF